MVVDKSKIPSEKKFSGYEFTAYGAYPTLAEANKIASKEKKEGFHVHIVKYVRAKGYAVFIRGKGGWNI
jgi:hypothetical protein